MGSAPKEHFYRIVDGLRVRHSDYEDVAFIENLLSDLNTEDYLFIRVGESDDDTEYRGGFWGSAHGMCLVRGIAFD